MITATTKPPLPPPKENADLAAGAVKKKIQSKPKHSYSAAEAQAIAIDNATGRMFGEGAA